MHVLTLANGEHVCAHCVRPFERHPSEERREALHKRLCAIEDDDEAARAFHYHRRIQAEVDALKTLWVPGSSFSLGDGCMVRFEGVSLHLPPDASPDCIRDELERWVLPSLRKYVLDALERKDAAMPAAPRIEEPRSYDPIVTVPASPSAAELYPSGYVRHADGSVEASS